MAGVSSGADFVVLDPTQPARVVDRGVRRIAEGIVRDAKSRTPIGPTGDLFRGWQSSPINPGVWLVVNDVRYARYVEFGTRKMDPQPMLGPALMKARSRVGA